MKFHEIPEYIEGEDDYPSEFITEYEFPCPFCECDHTHVGEFKGKFYRICYDCGEMIEVLT